MACKTVSRFIPLKALLRIRDNNYLDATCLKEYEKLEIDARINELQTNKDELKHEQLIRQREIDEQL